MSRSTGSSIVHKCTCIVDVLTEARKPLAFAQIVDATGFVKSSAHRLLAVLLSEQMVEYDPQSRTYSAGSRISQWAKSSWLHADLQALATPELERLCDISEMNVNLSVLDQNSILYIKSLDSIRMRFAVRPGDTAPLHCTAAGKLFLAFMSERKRTEIFRAKKFQKFTDKTIVSPKLLMKDLEHIRKQGFSLAVQEEIQHVVGVAVPILDNSRAISACISICSLSDRSTVAQMKKFVPEMVTSARRISTQFF